MDSGRSSTRDSTDAPAMGRCRTVHKVQTIFPEIGCTRYGTMKDGSSGSRYVLQNAYTRYGAIEDGSQGPDYLSIDRMHNTLCDDKWRFIRFSLCCSARKQTLWDDHGQFIKMVPRNACSRQLIRCFSWRPLNVYDYKVQKFFIVLFYMKCMMVSKEMKQSRTKLTVKTRASNPKWRSHIFGWKYCITTLQLHITCNCPFTRYNTKSAWYTHITRQ